MADFQSIAESFTAAGAGSEVLQLRAGGCHILTWHLSGTFVADMDIQVASPGGTDWVTIAGETQSSPAIRNVTLVGSWDVRLNCTDYTSGTAVNEVKGI